MEKALGTTVVLTLLAAQSLFADAPEVTITAPLTGWLYEQGQTTFFTGTATDAEDEDLTLDLEWTSSIDGLVGTGGSPDWVLSEGFHVITAQVTDSSELSGSDSVELLVAVVCGEDVSVKLMIEFGPAVYGASARLIFGPHYTATDSVYAWAPLVRLKDNVVVENSFFMGNISGSTGCDL
jgi:hypothetical protein